MKTHAIFTILSYSIAVNAHQAHQTCRCRPSEPCWPSTTQWQALNTSIAGNLAAVLPIASSCHDPTFNANLCKHSLSSANNSVWRGEQPGAVQWANWEAWPSENQTCYFNRSRQSPCHQGRISLYSAAVDTAEQIQAVVCFAKEYNVRLAIKNTGHDFLGRSTAPESLQIATYKMRSIEFVDDFAPTVPPTCSEGKGASYGSAVTIGAGVQVKQLYTAASARNLTVVSGLSHTVGAAGGYIQGGGHSPLGNWKGMASDNVLEFKIVISKGDLVVANAYQNQDLFWALRGGGGGTFGVVVSVTIRTFPDAPAYLATFGFGSPAGNSSYWTALTALHAHLPAISDAGGAGYYFVKPLVPVNGTMTSQVLGSFLFANCTSEDHVRDVMNPAVDAVRAIVGDSFLQYQVDFLPQMKYYFEEALKGDADTTGDITVLGSRMISRDFLTTQDGPGNLTSALQAIDSLAPGAGFTSHVVAGGAVAAQNNTSDSSALNPAWRRAVTHILFTRNWNVTSSLAEQKAIQHNVTHVEVPMLKALEPDMGAYLNEADPDEEDFQSSFWGGNYARLYELKQKWDSESLLIVRRGVGSEDWDEDGICRVG